MVAEAHGHSRWGSNDQIGAANLLTPERRLTALGLVRTARIYDVSHTISAATPFMAPNQTPFLISMFASWRDSLKRRRSLGFTNEGGVNVERIEMTTHIDALGHFTKGDRLYNDLMLDVADLDGGKYLNAGRIVTPDDLARA